MFKKDILSSLYEELLEEGRSSQYNFISKTLQDAYKESYRIFIDKGFTTASTFAIWDFIYRLLPETIKTDEVREMKKKYFGNKLRQFVVNLINSKFKYRDQVEKLAAEMTDVNNVVEYLNKQDHGNRRRGKLNALSKQSEREITKDF